MTLNCNIVCEPGKRIVEELVRLKAVLKNENGDCTAVLEYDTENILETGKWYRITSDKESGYVLVTNPYFKGAYDLPSFGISALVNEAGAAVRERSLRFKNVTVEPVSEADVNSVNAVLEKEGLHYYDVLGRIKHRPERADKYWYVKLNRESGVAEVLETADTRTEEDDRRYNNTANYYVTVNEANAAAKELNDIIL